MRSQVIEGTWEEVKLRDPELRGRYVRLTVTQPPVAKAALTESGNAVRHTKKLRGYGALSGVLGTADYLKEKRLDTLREDRSLS